LVEEFAKSPPSVTAMEESGKKLGFSCPFKMLINLEGSICSGCSEEEENEGVEASEAAEKQ